MKSLTYTYDAARLLQTPADRMLDNKASDAVLIARARERDKRALEMLYDRHSRAAMGLAVRMLGDQNSAEEIVQETFWRIWTRAGTFDSKRGNFSAWLFGIVHNLAIDELRKRKSQSRSSSVDWEDEALTELADARVDVVESALLHVTGEQVRTAMTLLPDSQRNVIELAYFDGLTHQEIASKLAEPVGTIHTRARLGLQRLREQLGQMYAEDLNH